MTNNQRALQVWSVLALAARNQQILSYTTLEKLTGVPGRGQAPILAVIFQYCKRKKFPLINYLVVNERDGLPGYIDPGDPETVSVFKEQSRVFVFDWLKQKPPSEADF